MIYLNRVAREIKGVGFYDSLLQDVKERLKKDEVEVWEIEELLKSDESLLKEYKELNLEYNLSNIHIKEISLSGLKDECKRDAKIFNENLKKLKELEKYTLDFSRSSFLVLLFSVEFFVLFSVQYFIVLLSLKEYQLLIYGLFLSSVFAAWWYARRERKKYEKNSEKFYKIYGDSLDILLELEKRGCIKRDELYVKESEDHI